MAVIESTGCAELTTLAIAAAFQNGCVEVYGGARPANANAAAGTLLGRITRDGGTWVAGSPGNGLRFDASGQYVVKRLGDVWALKGVATGTATWCRWLPNDADDGLPSSSAIRVDCDVGLTDAVGDVQLRLLSTAITPATSLVINNWWYAVPPLGA